MNRPNGKPKKKRVYDERPVPAGQQERSHTHQEKSDLKADAINLADEAHDPDVVVPRIDWNAPGNTFTVDPDEEGPVSALTDLANNYIKNHEAPVAGGNRKPGQVAKV